MSTVPEFVKESRKKVNLSREEFVGRVGVAPAVVRKIDEIVPIYIKDYVPLEISAA